MSKKSKIIYGIVAVLAIMMVIVVNSSSIIVDYQWFKELGYTEVFWYKFLTQVKIFVPVFLVTFVIMIVYSRYIKKESAKYAKVVEVNGHKSLLLNIASLAVSAIFAWIVSSNLWNDILMFMNGTNFGVKDSVYKNDIGFYVFKLPFIEKIYGLSFGFLIFLVIVTAIFYFITIASNVSYSDVQNKRNPFSKKIMKPILSKLAVFVLLFFIIVAIGYQIKAYDILFSTFGSVLGAGYTDIHVTKPFCYILIVATIILGLIFTYGLVKKNKKLVVGVVIAFMALNILQPISEGVVQTFIVKANEVAKEQPYILNSIEYTRKAYALDNLKEEQFTLDNKLDAKGLEKNKEIVDNIRINDYKPALQVYNQLQGIRPYYQFKDVDVDRYTIDGKETQVFLSAREIDPSNIPSDTWINNHLKYTHGYGIVMSPVNSVTKEGQPNLITKDIPPTTKYKNLKVSRPEIYFGEMNDYYVLTNTSLKEFNYPSGDNNKESIYNGKAGIKLSGLNKLLFALNEGDVNFLFSGYLNNNSKILLHRNIMDRVEKLAPFLKFDKDPYLVIDNGKLYWIIDGYTTSNMYPYSQNLEYDGGNFNYIRNSVKAVVDAYNGTTNFYISDKKDPIIKTYSKIFKNMFKPIEKMPKVLRQHLRYPQTLFDSQELVLRRYHVDNPQVFYNNEDTWNKAQSDTGTGEYSVESHYLHMRLPNEKNMEFAIMAPYTPKNKQNMVAWLCGRMDGDNYGKLVLYKLPKQQLIYGSQQIEARINQDPNISKELTLWGQQGASVLRGDVFVVPIEKSILYVQPLYIKSNTSSSIPELKRVIVAYNDSIIMEENLKDALNKIFNISDEQTTETTTETEKALSKESIKTLIENADKTYTKAVNAQKNGDWAEYGKQINKLKLIIEQMKKEK